jgi:hypothetical protein
MFILLTFEATRSKLDFELLDGMRDATPRLKVNFCWRVLKAMGERGQHDVGMLDCYSNILDMNMSIGAGISIREFRADRRWQLLGSWTLKEEQTKSI